MGVTKIDRKIFIFTKDKHVMEFVHKIKLMIKFLLILVFAVKFGQGK